ncbi:hypothetical protein [Thiomicrorhabdus sediminis]|uniref:Uncharacterized protein n=1 Tax=Thiomicrorhabdus sediminis TaxID=2580412 RepID=A0A4P9K5B5_9GAMM|nr:hypothetical protein [Thiomicrorhabdus sediminis]QCU89436.1 hypothetical protein FE785_01705 [Thiomicrorhabdus sediminis]
MAQAFAGNNVLQHSRIAVAGEIIKKCNIHLSSREHHHYQDKLSQARKQALEDIKNSLHLTDKMELETLFNSYQLSFERHANQIILNQGCQSENVINYIARYLN